MVPSNRAALVTGGARRVGRAIVLELARGGCDVAIHYRRSRAEAQTLVEEVQRLGRRVIAVEGDLSRAEDCPRIVQETVDQLGQLNILINNASVFHTDGKDTLAAFDVQRWRETLETNVISPVALCQAAQSHLRSNGKGKVVNLCDVSAERPWPDHLAYCASKAALVTVTRALAKAMAPHVQVNGVAPGIAVFPQEYSAELRERLIAKVPLKRAGTPEEVARLVRFLVDDGDYITGQIIAIDGGRSVV